MNTEFLKLEGKNFNTPFKVIRQFFATISCFIFLILLQVYYNQEILGITKVGKYLLAVLIGYSMYKTVYVACKYKLEPLMKMFLVLLILFLIYGVAHWISGPPRYFRFDWGAIVKADNLTFLKQVLASLPMVFVYYDFAKKGVFTPRVLDGITFILLAFSVLSFVQFYVSWGSNQYLDGIQNNQGYKFTRLLPLIFLLKRWRMFLILICYFFIIISLKRGAILLGTMCMVLYFFLWYKKAKRWKKILAIITVIAIVIGIGYGVKYFYDNSKGFQERIDRTLDGDDSGRSTLSDDIWYKLGTVNDSEILWFGNGPDTTLDYAGNYAHNDWLEILCNQGIMGVIIYALFYLAWVKAYFRMRKVVAPETSVAFLAGLLTALGCTIFSMGYTSLGGVAAILVAVCLVRYSDAEEKAQKKS